MTVSNLQLHFRDEGIQHISYHSPHCRTCKLTRLRVETVRVWPRPLHRLWRFIKKRRKVSPIPSPRVSSLRIFIWGSPRSEAIGSIRVGARTKVASDFRSSILGMSTTTRPPSPGGEGSIDPAPLLGGGGRSGRGPSLRTAARFLRRASGRRMMREPSMMVRETAAEHLEERQNDWAYSKPVVFLDILWNLAFVGVAVGVLILSRDETPSMPLRLWIVGYAFQCLLHMVCVCIEYRRRHPTEEDVLDVEVGSNGRSSGSNSPREIGESADDAQHQDEDSNG
ncbi:hypothetical protein BHE74_00057611 [Ensete ventricosum]|nr:hypothetical protein GW17_00012713 [Ensete ventricosum]RWW37301.1 hypothetical protein BHE74_00057611 [Ensete ventricosum]